MEKRKVGIKPLKVPLLADEATRDQIISEHFTEVSRRMFALAEQLNVPVGENMWFWVAYELAKRHVPELQEQRPTGRPQKWDAYAKGVLVVEVERVRGERDLRTNKAACSFLCTQEPWKSLLTTWTDKKSHDGPDPAEALLAVLKAGKREKWHRIARQARKACLHLGYDWQERVMAVKERTL